MFGIIISGRLVQTDFTQVSDTQFLFNIADADSINHIVIFMTGQTPFPDDFGGAVYFAWPSPEGPSWILLGHITNQKPSAIFKISSFKPSANNQSPVVHFGDVSQKQSHQAQIGISAEPLSQLAQQVPATHTTASSMPSFVEFSTKMLENFFNYASSFAVTQGQMVPNPSENFVPLSTLKNWYESFQRKLQNNPNFWKS